ncbi:MAG: hypothetical protein JNK68_00260 [Betaproteobacteria bacterium]|nr:hypothetical protein [Betaproteobacteria bacterium]
MPLCLVVAAALLVCSTGSAAAPSVSRGEALYDNHCVSCHTCQAHTRRDPIVRNLGELAQQVDRWQANQKLGWTPEDRAAVVDYLNRVFYKF